MRKCGRREFVKATAAAGVMTALSRRRVLGASDRVRVGLIGCGGRGMQHWKRFLGEPDVEPVAVCDVYEPFLRRAAEAAGSGVSAYRDFRQLIERQDVEAVIVATPDHWHALQTVMACEAGKDVYVEKPLSLTVREGRAMLEAARRHRRVVQVGCQQRSSAHYLRAVKLVQEGAIGEVHSVAAGFARNVMPGFVARELKNGLTGDLNWDMWLGPAPLRPFDPFRCIYHFRWFWDYSGGQMTNWGAHHLDIARWALNVKGPTLVAGFGGRYSVKDGGETPDVQEVLYDFPAVTVAGGRGCVVRWTARELNQGRQEPLVFYGTQGTLSVSRDELRLAPEAWHGEGPKSPPVVAELLEPGVAGDALHVRNFLDCVKSRDQPTGDVEDGHYSAVMCHLGNLSMRLGRSLRWDPEREEVIGDAEANRRLHYQYRKPWKLEGV